ncbi:AfsR/SARP family transcriptional regulator [Streptosporangium sp. NPDC051023]|uniref:AfsR/SARP family transcriptional regulator n=1 Tax=Streptosporangium sp. NPDC051023 TaxID=3155410 RepID=UPI00344CFB18
MQRADSLLDEALALWRGDALADVRDAPFAGTAGARLEELRAAAIEDRFEAGLRLGRHDEILADMAAVAACHPLRERLAGLRMRTLHAAGRQSEALAVFEQVRGTLAEELGVDPSEELRKSGSRRSGEDPAGRGGGEPAAGPSAWPGLARPSGRGDHGGRAARGGAGHAQRCRCPAVRYTAGAGGQSARRW